MPLPTGPGADRTRSVFINCPFDPDYKPLMQAACFAIMSCGYIPRCALDFGDSGAVRFIEIVRLITACDWSIHDISRVELDRTSLLPRFNMPLELGADLGLRIAGPPSQRRRKSLILDAEAHRYDKTLSDISGVDIQAHANDVSKIIRLVRDWLNANREAGSSPLPGGAAINADHDTYLESVHAIVANLRLDPHGDMSHADYLYVARVALSSIAATGAGARGAGRKR